MDRAVAPSKGKGYVEALLVAGVFESRCIAKGRPALSSADVNLLLQMNSYISLLFDT
jgi:hypothetical protein